MTLSTAGDEAEARPQKSIWHLDEGTWYVRKS